MEVVNKKTIGSMRPGHGYDTYIGRGSLLGNPFPVKEFGREKAIRCYKLHFDYMIKHSQEFKSIVNTLQFQKRLVCYCAPKPCHGDIIKEYLENL